MAVRYGEELYSCGMFLYSALPHPSPVAMAGHGVKHTNAADSPPVSSKRLATLSAKKKALTEMPISLRKVLWQSNLHWTDTLITFLSENPETHLKLFSDSVKTAKTQGCAKVWISSPMLGMCN